MTCGNPNGIRSQPAPFAKVPFLFPELPYPPNQLYSLNAIETSVDPLRKPLPFCRHLT
jgi:hypothetical protein